MGSWNVLRVALIAIRRNLVRRLQRTLSERHLKDVRIRFI